MDRRVLRSSSIAVLSPKVSRDNSSDNDPPVRCPECPPPGVVDGDVLYCYKLLVSEERRGRHTFPNLVCLPFAVQPPTPIQ